MRDRIPIIGPTESSPRPIDEGGPARRVGHAPASDKRPCRVTIVVEGETPDELSRSLCGVLAKIGQDRAMPAVVTHGELSTLAPVVPAAPSIDEVAARWRDELSARCKPSSINRMTSCIAQAAAFAGWGTVNDVTYESATAFLAARKRGGWSGPTYDQTVSVLRVFGEFLRRAKITPLNLLGDLRPSGVPGKAGSRALTVEEVRRLICFSVDRHLASRRAKGCAPLFWTFLALTGLRHAEGASIKWRDIDLAGTVPAIYTDPDWTGNKANRTDIVPLCPELVGMLARYRATVPSGDADPIFPRVPTRETFGRELAAAGIPKRDSRRRSASVHSLRKSFCTWLDHAQTPAGLRSMLARHAQTLTERDYTDHQLAEMAAAVGRLPVLWPVNVEIFSITARKSAGLGAGSRYSVPVTQSRHGNATHGPSQPESDRSALLPCNDCVTTCPQGPERSGPGSDSYLVFPGVSQGFVPSPPCSSAPEVDANGQGRT